MRQAIERLWGFGRQAERVVDEAFLGLGFIDLGVVAGEIAHAQLAHQLVAALHLGHAPGQAIGGLLHVGDHRAQQVRNAFVDRHFKHLRVYHQQPHIARLGLVEQRQDHGVDPHRLARAGRARDQYMRHLRQVGDHGIADDVLAQAHGQHALGIVVDLGAQHFGQTDGLALGVGQLQRHVVLAGNGFHHAHRHQRQRARQVLAQAHDLRALDAGRRLDFIARDHRAGHGRDHTHFDAEVLELLLYHAAGHFQRVGRDGFLALQRGIEQVDLRQLGIGQIVEQRLLLFLDHALAGRGSGLHDRLDDLYRQRMAFHALDALFLHIDLARARRLAAHGDILGLFMLGPAHADHGIDASAQALGQLAPGEAKHQRRAQHQQDDAGQARAGETQPVHAVQAEHIADHPARMPGQQRLEAVHARPFKRGTGQQQQRQPAPEAQAAAPQRLGRRHAATRPAQQRGKPVGDRGQHQPPDGKAKAEIAGVGQPGTRAPDPVVHQRALQCARGRPGRVLRRIAQQRQQQEDQRQQPDDQADFMAEAGQAGTGG